MYGIIIYRHQMEAVFMISSQTALKTQVSPWRRFLRTPELEESKLVVRVREYRECHWWSTVWYTQLYRECHWWREVRYTQLYSECHWWVQYGTHSYTVIVTGGVECGTHSCTGSVTGGVKYGTHSCTMIVTRPLSGLYSLPFSFQ